MVASSLCPNYFATVSRDLCALCGFSALLFEAENFIAKAAKAAKKHLPKTTRLTSVKGFKLTASLLTAHRVEVPAVNPLPPATYPKVQGLQWRKVTIHSTAFRSKMGSTIVQEILRSTSRQSLRRAIDMNRSIIRWMILSLVLLSFCVASFGQIAVGVSVRVGPPALPVYAQPICPGPGYIWTPGYWGWKDDAGYYWVPGTWVVAPVGLLWTPGYWGWAGGVYAWHAGYWGPHVGFYGGINYGFGYTGVGFVGGAWHGGVYSYNTAVTNVNTTVVHNTYNTTVINNNTTVNRVSYNGGTGGTTAQP